MTRKYHDNWFAKARKIKANGMRCEVCGYVPPSEVKLDIHHINRVIDGGNNDDENLMLLCEKCHADVHGYKKKKWIDIYCYEFHYGKQR